MPIHKNEFKFELVPYGFFQTIIITFTILLLGGALIFLGFYYQQFQSSWILFVLAGVAFVGALIYLVIRIVKIVKGRLDCISIDFEGVRVYNKHKGTIKFLSWDQIENISKPADSNGEFSSIIISSVKEVITIQLDRFATVFLNTEKIAEQTEKAYRSFRQKFHKSTK